MGCVCQVGEFVAVAARFVHRAGAESVGRVCAARGARARLEAAAGRKRAGARQAAQTHSAGGHVVGVERTRARLASLAGTAARSVGRRVGTRARAVAESAELAACGRRLRSLRGRVAGAGYAVARARAVIISGGETKKKGFFAKKNTKNAPRRIKTRARAFIRRRARVFCLPRAGAGAYIARI